MAAALLAFFPVDGAGDQLIDIDHALKKIFPKISEAPKKRITLLPEMMDRIEKAADITFGTSHAAHIDVYTVHENGAVAGYAFEDIVIGKWGPIHYLVGVSPQGQVIKAVVLDYQEIRGKPIAKNRFLKQYQGKSLRDPLRLRADIDGVTGATISSRSFTDGVRKILHIFLELHPGEFTP